MLKVPSTGPLVTKPNSDFVQGFDMISEYSTLGLLEKSQVRLYALIVTIFSEESLGNPFSVIPKANEKEASL